MKRYIIILSIAFLFSCKKEDSNHVFNTPCGTQYPPETVALLLELSDTATLKTMPDLEYRLQTISGIFTQYKDSRGLFPSVYRATTELAVLSLENGVYEDPQTAIDVSLAFGKRYLYNLFDHIVGRRPEYHWKQYYELCENCSGNKTRIVTSGINAHLTVDLARAIADGNAGLEFEHDYVKLGDVLVNAAPVFIQYLRENYDLETEYLFSGLFFGEAIDSIFGEGFTRSLAFQFIRVEAFDNAQRLLNSPHEPSVQKRLEDNWENREQILDELLRQGLFN